MKKSKLIRQVAVAFAIVFMSAVLCGAGCSNVASDSGGGTSGGGGGTSGGGGASSTMTGLEAIAAINALQSGGSITIKLDSSVTTISTDLKNALKDANKYVVLDLSQSGVDISVDANNTGDALFGECNSLEEVKLPNGATKIGNFTFCNCRLLRSVEIPSSVTSIGNHAFYLCKSLRNVTIPSNVTSIGDYAFRECNSLRSVEIPNSVTRIDSEAFNRCTSLNTIKYTGSKDDWNTKITVFGTLWRSQVPATGVTCSDGKTYKFVGNTSSSADSKLGAEI